MQCNKENFINRAAPFVSIGTSALRKIVKYGDCSNTIGIDNIQSLVALKDSFPRDIELFERMNIESKACNWQNSSLSSSCETLYTASSSVGTESESAAESDAEVEHAAWFEGACYANGVYYQRTNLSINGVYDSDEWEIDRSGEPILDMEMNKCQFLSKPGDEESASSHSLTSLATNHNGYFDHDQELDYECESSNPA